jgi:hypothetical protein
MSEMRVARLVFVVRSIEGLSGSVGEWSSVWMVVRRREREVMGRVDAKVNRDRWNSVICASKGIDLYSGVRD